MNDADQFLCYVLSKRRLLQAALAYAENPTEGQAYTLRVLARAFASSRKKAKVQTPISEEP